MWFVGLTDLSLSCGEAPVPQRQSGAPLAATNVKTAGCVCKRRDAVRLGRKEGLQPRPRERPAASCSEKLGGRRSAVRLLTNEMHADLPRGAAS